MGREGVLHLPEKKLLFRGEMQVRIPNLTNVKTNIAEKQLN